MKLPMLVLKFLFGLSLAVQGASSLAFADGHANTIPAQCEDLAKRFLIQGDYQSDKSGARFWNLSGFVSPPSGSSSDADCLAQIWRQAYTDQKDYWHDVAQRYRCLDSAADAPPASPPTSCARKEWTAIRANFDFLNMIKDLTNQKSAGKLAVGDPTCLTDPTGGSIKPVTQAVDNGNKVVAKLNEQLAQSQGGPAAPGIRAPAGSAPVPVKGAAPGAASLAPTMNSGIKPDELTAGAPAGSSTEEAPHSDRCDGIPKSDLKAQYGGPKDPTQDLVHYGVDCLASAAQGIINNLKEMVTGVWDLAKFALKSSVQLTKATMRLIKACFNGSVATMARESYLDSGKVLEKIVNYLKEVPQAIGGLLIDQVREFGCLNGPAQMRKTCESLAYLGTDILYFVPGAQEFAVAQLTKLPGFTKAVSALKIVTHPIETTRAAGEAVKVAADAAKAGELGAVVAKITEVSSNVGARLANMNFVKDISSGMSVVVEGGKVFLKNTVGKFYEVTFQPLKDRFLAAWKRRAVLKEDKARTSLAEMADGMEKKKPATLPKRFVPDSELGKVPVSEAPADWSAWISTVGQESIKNGKFLGFKVLEAPTADIGGMGGRFGLRDANRVKHEFTRVAHDDGTWWFQSGTKIAGDSQRFAVYLDIPPANLAKMLPDVMAQATKRGGQFFEVGGSADALKSGQRMTVWFQDAQDAQKFADKMAPRLKGNLCRHGGGETFGGRLAACISIDTLGYVAGQKGLAFLRKNTRRAVLGTAGCTEDPLCTCHIYLNAGINPEDEKPIDLSPFTCDASGYVSKSGQRATAPTEPPANPATQAPAPGQPSVPRAPASQPVPRAPASVPVPAQPAASTWSTSPNPNAVPPQPAQRPTHDLSPGLQAKISKLPDRPLTYGELDQMARTHENKCGIPFSPEARIQFEQDIVDAYQNQLQQVLYALTQSEPTPEHQPVKCKPPEPPSN